MRKLGKKFRVWRTRQLERQAKRAFRRTRHAPVAEQTTALFVLGATRNARKMAERE
jgi:hypothetical protein